MNRDANLPAAGFAAGQLWNTDNTYLQIVELGRNLVHYRIMRQPGQTGLVSGLIRIEALAIYLMACEATLIA